MNRLRRTIRDLAGRPDLPVLPIVERSLVPVLRPAADLDRSWLEMVAAVRPRLARARGAPARSRSDPVAGGDRGARRLDRPVAPGRAGARRIRSCGRRRTGGALDRVAIAVLDAWTDSVPSRRHATTAAFGFNAPKSRAPQAVLLAVPPDPDAPLGQRRPGRRSARDPRARPRPGGPSHRPRRPALRDAGPARPRRGTAQLPRRVAGMTDPLYLWLEPGRPDTTKVSARASRTRSGSSPASGSSASTRARTRRRPVVVASAPHHVPITYDPARPDLDPTVVPAEALLEAEPGDWWTIGRRRPPGPRRGPDARRGGARAISRSGRCRRRTTTSPARSTASRCSWPALLAGARDLGRGADLAARPLVAVRAQLRRVLRRRRHRPAAPGGTTAATSTGSPSTVNRTPDPEPPPRCPGSGR